MPNSFSPRTETLPPCGALQCRPGRRSSLRQRFRKLRRVVRASLRSGDFWAVSVCVASLIVMLIEDGPF